MRKFLLLICCAAVMFAVSGCSQGAPGPVTTDQDEIDAYNAMINDPANMGEDDDPDEE